METGEAGLNTQLILIKKPQLHMYEIIHALGVKDWVIAHTGKEAINILERVHYNYTEHYTYYNTCKIVRLDSEMQTFTPKGLVSVKQIIEHYGKPYYIYAG